MVVYNRGDTVFKSRPFAFIILNKYRDEVCEFCWEKIKLGLVSCPGCQQTKYCSQSCLDAGEKEHQEECQILRSDENQLTELPDQLRLVLRLWVISKNNEKNVAEHGAGISRKWEDLMDHASDLGRDSQEFIQIQFDTFSRCISSTGMPTLEQFRSIYGKILTNSFSLRTDRFSRPEPFGTGVYLLPSLLDHSCIPNCTVVFRGKELHVVATEEIPEGRIDEVAKISYVNSMDDTSTRQAQQLGIWYFKCDCTLCLDKSLDGSKHGVVCDNCGVPSNINVKIWSLIVKCMACGSQISSSRISRYRELFTILERAEEINKLRGDEGEETDKMRMEEMGGMSYEELCEWAVGEMEDVFSERMKGGWLGVFMERGYSPYLSSTMEQILG
ncbi:histone-lysine N-methyltransferase SMYD3 isoform X2 [Eurytemora carolleeae]|uniref:histone-lysine N-methyltransferase SMYD3 isoform X2 n=1 Tax=Eurytemora carolleeae TaxID=1294199 RepID=UPI000C76FF68|nr:histone-lysine N-methyltransferase SMYD3 isoform X2 [Eurytemora carolleeae]|eukprot:XP_023338856.1 histone-lysine N-methyltransferase SMYD3-like isoform X2 [Eurytemora affinis]